MTSSCTLRVRLFSGSKFSSPMICHVFLTWVLFNWLQSRDSPNYGELILRQDADREVAMIVFGLFFGHTLSWAMLDELRWKITILLQNKPDHLCDPSPIFTFQPLCHGLKQSMHNGLLHVSHLMDVLVALLPEFFGRSATHRTQYSCLPGLPPVFTDGLHAWTTSGW